MTCSTKGTVFELHELRNTDHRRDVGLHKQRILHPRNPDVFVWEIEQIESPFDPLMKKIRASTVLRWKPESMVHRRRAASMDDDRIEGFLEIALADRTHRGYLQTLFYEFITRRRDVIQRKLRAFLAPIRGAITNQ